MAKNNKVYIWYPEKLFLDFYLNLELVEALPILYLVTRVAVSRFFEAIKLYEWSMKTEKKNIK